MTEKFTFDLDFDEERARVLKERQTQQAEKKRQQEEIAREESKLRYTPEQIEEIKNQAREEGRQLGAIESTQSQESQIVDALTKGLGKIQTLSEQEVMREKLAQRTGIETAFQLLQKISPSLTKGKEINDINALIEQAFAENPNEQRLVIRVHDSILDVIVKNIDKAAGQAGFSGKPIVLSDQSLTPQDCRIEWADGGLERMTGTLWDGLEKAINHILVGMPAKTKKQPKKKTEEAVLDTVNESVSEKTNAESDNNTTTQKEEVSDE